MAGLLEKFNVDPKSIGRLDVGTETIIDKSKSVKTTLMDLFAESGNFDIEGIDSKNACYGGTAALFNAINWVESSSWDGRNAIVVAGDIAVYAEGAARPAGGAGCVAILIGPDAPVVFERELTYFLYNTLFLIPYFHLAVHGSYMCNTYDFYKPNLTSEYPVVDGPVSVVTYIAALDGAYTAFRQKAAKAAKRAALHGSDLTDDAFFSLESVDYALFHSPYGKQAVKGHARMLFNDFLNNPKAPHFANIPKADSFLTATHAESLTDKNVEKTFIAASKASFKQKTDPGMSCSRRIGNTYTGSLYGCLASLLSNVESTQLQGKRVSLFSFGSGFASSFFTLRIKGDPSQITQKMNLLERLSKMSVVPPQEFIKALEVCDRRLSCTPAFTHFFFLGSSEKRTIMRWIIRRKVPLRIFGQALIILIASTPSIGESMLGLPLLLEQSHCVYPVLRLYRLCSSRN